MLSGCESSSLPLSSCRCVSRAQRQGAGFGVRFFWRPVATFSSPSMPLETKPRQGMLAEAHLRPSSGGRVGWGDESRR